MAYPEHLDPIEREIIDVLVKDALTAGYLVSVFDGEAYGTQRSADYEEITAAIAATDETSLAIRAPGSRKIDAWVKLIHGNGADVISDCTDNETTSALLKGAEAKAEEFAEAC